MPRAQYVELKANVHKKLLNRLNLEALALVDRARAESEIRGLVGELLAEDNTPISLGERDLLLGEVIDEVFGLGPLEPLLRDPSISDILVNTYKHVFVERGGVLERAATSFQGTRVPRPGRRMISALPPTSVVTTGTPQASVSRRTLDQPSVAVARQKTSEALIQRGISSWRRGPTIRTLDFTPRRFAASVNLVTSAVLRGERYIHQPLVPVLAGAVTTTEQTADLLTGRERDVLAALAKGGSNQTIADSLFLAPETVKSHLSRVYAKLGVSGRNEAVARAVAMGLLG